MRQRNAGPVNATEIRFMWIYRRVMGIGSRRYFVESLALKWRKLRKPDEP